MAKPFLRWAGGKRWFIKHLAQYLPENINNYHEPFLGGGSVYWRIKQLEIIGNNSYLSDTNNELIETYIQVQENIEGLIALLETYENTSEFYYQIRAEIPEEELNRAARFLYLNAASYNGIYRVNRDGVYNVPYGRRNMVNLFDIPNLRECSRLLDDTVFLNTSDFDIVRERLEANDLVFLDPPYTVAHENNGFIQYNQQLFSWGDQERLSELLEFVNNNGAYFILTNAAHPSIGALFGNIGNRFDLDRHSTIGGRGANRSAVNEYVFTNIVR